jgi:peptidoglycan/LPS O-acetylase OafA/YrhL
MLAIRRGVGLRDNDWRPYAAAMMFLGLIGLLADLLPAAWQPGRAFLPHEAWYFALGIASHGVRTRASRPAGLWWAVALLAAIFLQWQQPSMTAMVVPLLWTACLICEAPRIPRPFRPLARALNAAALQWFGRISYPLYLIHLPVQRLLMLAVAPAAGGNWAHFSLLWGPPAILLPVMAAHALHHRVELPCWRWSRARALASQRNEPALALSLTRGG